MCVCFLVCPILGDPKFEFKLCVYVNNDVYLGDTHAIRDEDEHKACSEFLMILMKKPVPT